ncbi:serine hydrolase [Allorhizobium sonneratiae]|uniref:serine hydrolase n=1 Tax=Allorhizobium sonneratiae TaxID=2934936 RepID=UPI0030844E64
MRSDATRQLNKASEASSLALGSALSPTLRAHLTEWMMASRDAAAQRLLAGLPAGWRIANKPGTWEGSATNHIGGLFPPNRPPIVVAAYLGRARGSVTDQEAVLAEVARIIIMRSA